MGVNVRRWCKISQRKKLVPRKSSQSHKDAPRSLKGPNPQEVMCLKGLAERQVPKRIVDVASAQ